MATLTIRNVRPQVVRSLKSRAKRNRRSMEQEVREILERQAIDRRAVMARIERAWAEQKRPTTAEEIEAWINEGRS